MKINTAIYVCIPLLGIVMAGCESESGLEQAISGPAPLFFKAPTLMSASTGTSELPEEVNLYEFVDGKFRRSQTFTPGPEVVELSVSGNSKVFAVAGADIAELSESTTADEFKSILVSSPEGADSAPMFYAGVSVLGGDDETLSLELTRGVARIDVACTDPRIRIKEIIVEDAPARSYVFPASAMPEGDATVRYSRTVDDMTEGYIEQAFTVYESSRPVTIRVKGTFDGDPMNLSKRIASMDRNKVYTLGVSGGSDLEASVTVADWEPGDVAEGIYDLGDYSIDTKKSVIPEGVKIDPADNSISIPHTGVKDMTLVFTAKAPVEFGSLLGGNDSLSVEKLSTETDGDICTTSFLVNVAPQPKCAAAYDATLILKSNANFFLNMNVEASPYQIPTVKMAGMEWMCFNAISDNVDEQLYVEEGTTVDEMYDEHFTECLGMYFQYGKGNPFSPWCSNDPTQFADQARDVPWRTAGTMPLPKGFHVPTLNEWKALIPTGTTIPASYRTASGDSIKATVVTLPGTLETPSAAVNARNFKKRYVLFESVTTGAKLYLPIMGLKSNTTDEVPGMKGYNLDVRTAYWASEERYVWLIDFKTQADGTEGALLQQNRWAADGFLPVRGVKD